MFANEELVHKYKQVQLDNCAWNVLFEPTTACGLDGKIWVYKHVGSNHFHESCFSFTNVMYLSNHLHAWVCQWPISHGAARREFYCRITFKHNKFRAQREQAKKRSLNISQRDTWTQAPLYANKTLPLCSAYILPFYHALTIFLHIYMAHNLSSSLYSKRAVLVFATLLPKFGIQNCGSFL